MKKVAWNALLCSAFAVPIITWAIAGSVATEKPEKGESEAPSYNVVDGKADKDTLMGYTVYTATCMPCHGPDGLGSTFAPNLVRIMPKRTYEGFKEIVTDGRSVLPGQVMPPFKDDKRVMAHLDDLWRYLSARADGALGRGRPPALEEGGGQ
jgi:mono/diheme cytochrome c family protein